MGEGVLRLLVGDQWVHAEDHTGQTVAAVGPAGNRGAGGDSRRSGQRLPESPTKALVADGQRDPYRWPRDAFFPVQLLELLPLAGRTAAHLAGHRNPNDSRNPRNPMRDDAGQQPCPYVIVP